MISRHILARAIATLAFIAVAAACAIAQPAQRITDSTVTQQWTSEYGYSILLPSVAKYNKIGSTFTKEGQTEKVNFILSGGGAVTVTYFTEPRMVPKDFRMLDSMHYYQYDSAGRNGTIHRRVYVLREHAIQMDVLLTEKGEKIYGALVPAIFDSFVPPKDAVFAIETWRYGRNPAEYEQGRYGAGSGPGH